MRKILWFLTVFLLASCQLSNTAKVGDEHSAQFALDYEGIYKGTFPCADCSGIETKLTLKSNGSYEYQQRYLEKGEFCSTGRYTVNENILTLQEKDGSLYFFIGERKIILLGRDKIFPQGEFASYYVLKKQDPFSYVGSYATYSEDPEQYQQTLVISPDKENYHVEFSASKVRGRENCRFSGTAQLKDNVLWVNISIDPDKENLMYIVPSHDNLGVDVFTRDFSERFEMMQYCRGGSSLAGEYVKNTIGSGNFGVITKDMTLAEVLHRIPVAQVTKKRGQGEFVEDAYDDYEVYDRNNRHLFTLTPKETGDTLQKIHRVLVTNPFFVTAKGIHCNSKYREIKNAYTIDKIEPTREHIVLVVDELHAVFTLPKTALRKGWWNEPTKTVDRSKIPDDAQAESCILWWNF